jgi:hypothetical protein
MIDEATAEKKVIDHLLLEFETVSDRAGKIYRSEGEKPAGPAVVFMLKEERSFGWVFSVQTKDYVKHGRKWEDMLLRGVTVVMREDGKIIGLPSFTAPHVMLSKFEEALKSGIDVSLNGWWKTMAMRDHLPRLRNVLKKIDAGEQPADLREVVEEFQTLFVEEVRPWRKELPAPQRAFFKEADELRDRYPELLKVKVKTKSWVRTWWNRFRTN